MSGLRKKILFFHFDLQGGGAEKVLINLIKFLDKDKYDITVYTIFGVGVNKKDFPADVNFKCVFKRLFRGANYLMKMISPGFLYKLLIREKYDVEIGYLETSPTRIISGSHNKKSKKYAWVHVEVENLEKFIVGFRDKDEAISCYNKLDGIFCVSKSVRDSFINNFPEVTVPVRVLYNVNDYDRIFKLAKEDIPIKLDNSCYNICSVGRLTSQKRYDRLINICAELNKQGYKFHIYILGEGEERKKLEQLIQKNNLNNVVELLGYDINPYKYVSKMDLFICSSLKEGYSTAVSEAVTLNIPVLTTDVSGMKEILNNGEYGLIVQNNETSLLEGLKYLLDNDVVLQQYRTALLSRKQATTQDFVEKYEELLDL